MTSTSFSISSAVASLAGASPTLSATLFKLLFDDAIAKQAITPGPLTLHADRGGPMKARAAALLLADLGVTKLHRQTEGWRRCDAPCGRRR